MKYLSGCVIERKLLRWTFHGIPYAHVACQKLNHREECAQKILIQTSKKGLILRIVADIAHKYRYYDSIEVA